MASLVVAFVVLSVLADSGRTGRRVITGAVIEWQPGETITVVNEQTDPRGVQVVLRDTLYDGRPGAIKPGVRVSVWYRGVGERLPIADKVRVLNE